MAVSTALSLTGLQKLGQPVPDSNLWLASKSLAPQQTQTKVPLKWPLAYLPEKAGSVAFIRVTMNCSGVSRFRHSSLVLNIRSGSLAALLESLEDSALFPEFSALFPESGAVPNGSCPWTATLAETTQNRPASGRAKRPHRDRVIVPVPEQRALHLSIRWRITFLLF